MMPEKEYLREIADLLAQFNQIASDPRSQLDACLAKGKKAIACFPYYVPEEIIAAAGMVPFGLWGKRGTTKKAKEYFASFYCSIAQMGLEMVLDGTLEGISGVVCTTLCDTLRPLTQNLKAASPVPVIFLAHPQNRKKDYGIAFTRAQLQKVLDQVQEISGCKVAEEDLHKAIHIYNENRWVCREFVILAGQHPELVTAVSRSAVLKARFFMEKEEHTKLLKKLNELLAAQEIVPWSGVRVVTSGIIMDNPALLKLFDDNRIAIVADDIAHESRGIRNDADETGDALTALAKQFAAQDEDPILYDPDINKRPDHIIRKVRECGAQGVIISMMAFCDPEEMEYPSLKKGLDEAGIPSIVFGYDHQMVDFGQAATALQAFAGMF